MSRVLAKPRRRGLQVTLIRVQLSGARIGFIQPASTIGPEKRLTAFKGIW